MLFFSFHAGNFYCLFLSSFFVLSLFFWHRLASLASSASFLPRLAVRAVSKSILPCLALRAVSKSILLCPALRAVSRSFLHYLAVRLLVCVLTSLIATYYLLLLANIPIQLKSVASNGTVTCLWPISLPWISQRFVYNTQLMLAIQSLRLVVYTALLHLVSMHSFPTQISDLLLTFFGCTFLGVAPTYEERAPKVQSRAAQGAFGEQWWRQAQIPPQALYVPNTLSTIIRQMMDCCRKLRFSLLDHLWAAWKKCMMCMQSSFMLAHTTFV